MSAAWVTVTRPGKPADARGKKNPRLTVYRATKQTKR